MLAILKRVPTLHRFPSQDVLRNLHKTQVRHSHLNMVAALALDGIGFCTCHGLSYIVQHTNYSYHIISHMNIIYYKICMILYYIHIYYRTLFSCLPSMHCMLSVRILLQAKGVLSHVSAFVAIYFCSDVM